VSIESDLRTYLLTLSSVTDKVGTGGDARIRPDRLHESDDESLQAIIIEANVDDPMNTLDGKGGLVYADVTLRCRATEKEDARSLAEAVRTNETDPGTGLAGYTGTAGSSTIGAVLEDTRTTFTMKDDGSDNGWYDVLANYVISFSETT